MQRSELSLERAAIQHAKKEMSDVKLQGEQGLQFVKQSVDMADLLRGFAITPQGIPIRDMARDRHGLLQGRSVLRERYMHNVIENREGAQEGMRACALEEQNLWTNIVTSKFLALTCSFLPKPYLDHAPPKITSHNGASGRIVACYNPPLVITPPAGYVAGVGTSNRMRTVTSIPYHPLQCLHRAGG